MTNNEQPVLQNSEIVALSAAEIASRVRERKLTPESVVLAHLEQIDKLDPEIGAFQQVCREQAILDARHLSTLSDLEKLPLAGVPVAIKDDTDVAGVPTRYGSGATSDTPAQKDAELVRRLKAAGCIVIGKTKMSELGIWPFIESPVFGKTSNPWDKSRTVGGSSGGSAAAVAAHMVPLALGSDGGGSIRVPSACCGIAGIKPGPGVIPNPKSLEHGWMGMIEFGPMARTIEDLQLMFDVLRGSSRTAPSVKSPLRIAVSTRPPLSGTRIDPEVEGAIYKLADLLSAAGHTVERSDPPYPKNVGVRFSSYWLCGIMEDARGLASRLLEHRTQSMVQVGKLIKLLGFQKPAAKDYLGRDVQKWFNKSNYDVLLMPTLSEPALKHGTWRGKSWLATSLGVGKWILTMPWNVARFPAASIPAGESSKGLPIGAQLVALPGNEDLLLNVMREIEHLHPWPRNIPS